MVDLAIPKPELVTAEAPQNRLGGDAFQTTPRTGIGAGLEGLASGVDDLAVAAAKQAGQQAARQAVSLDENGQVQVQTPQTSPIIVGRAGQAYDRAVADGVDPQLRLAISQQFTQMRQDYETDPNAKPQDWLKTTADFAEKWRADHPGPLGETGYTTALQLGNQHYTGIVDAATKQDLTNSKASITTELTTAQNTLYSIARQGGTTTPEYQEALTRWNAAYDKLKANGEMFGLAPASVEQRQKDAQIELIGQGLIGSVDRVVKDPGPNGGLAKAEELAKSIPGDPRFQSLSQGEQERLQALVQARVQFNREENKALINGNKAAAAALIDQGYAAGRPPPDEHVQGVIDNAWRMGDVDTATQLDAARKAYQANKPLLQIGQNAGPLGGSLHAESDALAFLKSSGWTHEQAAGILGNLVHESGGKLNPNAINRGDGSDGSDSIGIGQWNGPRAVALKAFAASQGKPWNDLGVQLAFVNHELTQGNERAAGAAIKSASNVRDAAAAAALKYERPKGSETGVAENTLGWSNRLDQATRLASGGSNAIIPFSAAQTKADPYLIAASYRQWQADKTGQLQTEKQYASGISNMMTRDNVMPTPQQVARVVQAGQNFPQELGETAQHVVNTYTGRAAGGALAQLPAGEGEARLAAVDSAVRASPSIAGAQQLTAITAGLTAARKQQSEEPQKYAADQGWRHPVSPLTPADPQAFAAQISDRVAGSHYIAQRLGQAPEQVTFGAQDKSDIASFLQSAPGPQARAAMQTLIGGLNTAAANELFRDKDTSKAIIAMSKSDDPDKINAGFQAMDAQYRRDPAQFDAQFPRESARLHDWQSRLSYYSPDEIAKQNLKANDPSQSTAIEAKEKAANDKTKDWTAEDVAKQFSSGITGYIPGLRALTGALPDVPPEFDSAKGAMLADFRMLYRDGFVQSGDHAQALDYAKERIANKYSVSPVNGNRVMAYAPEARLPKVNDSHDWVKRGLDDFVQKNVVPSGGSMGMMMPLAETVGGGEGTMTYYPTTTAEQTAYTKNYGARMLFADADTHADIAAGKLPTYAVIATDPQGRAVPLVDANLKPLRFDPKDYYQPALNAANAAAIGKHPAAQRANEAATPYYGGAG